MKLLSFCIPVMNRLGDVQATLRKNLDDNREDEALIEFILISFDADDAVEKWVQENFKEELSSGYLRFYRRPLKSWHFGKAKNAFRGLIRSKIYASLDGDNFTGHRGASHIIDVFKQHDWNCVFHQFQGDWGDGTCGRVSVLAEDYDVYGYDEDFLPRQWDEMDAMLSVFANVAGRSYVCYAGRSIINKSKPFARFLNENDCLPNVVELDPSLDPLYKEKADGQVAVGQHDSRYVEDDPVLRLFSVYNHLSSFYKNTKSSKNRTNYSAELVEAGRQIRRELDPAKIVNWFLKTETPSEPRISAGSKVLISSVKNEKHLGRWIDYYRRLGVDYFLLIDDGSDVPVCDVVAGPDIFVWTPLVGKFRYAKAHWMAALIERYARDCWCLTVDSDEYIDLPFDCEADEVTPLEHLIGYAEKRGIEYFSGYMLDLFPSIDVFDEATGEFGRDGNVIPWEKFENFQFRPLAAPPIYCKANTIKWSFGKYAPYAYRIDVRFRINRAYDSLRKFPIFKAACKFHLNQGFHDLILEEVKRSPDDAAREDVIPVIHFKLYNSQYDVMSASNRPADAYHEETRINLERLRRNLFRGMRVAAMSPYAFKYTGFANSPLLYKPSRADVPAAGASSDELIQLMNRHSCSKGGGFFLTWKQKQLFR